MKKLISHLILFLIVYNGFSQTKENNIYLLFNHTSNETYDYEIGNGKIGTDKIYSKEFKKNNNINFYIQKDLFISELKKNQIDTCNIKKKKKKKKKK